ncbi:hypothetical protein ABH926_008565 [Catenulispora sp. GP43]|uniref:hypothetical protein n=1 Tax=Catenulispora sp. GP43 TaxID=3156263 RepID=UPI0035181B1F
MRISMKVAPGVRVSGRLGGRHHHHRHGVRLAGNRQPRPWLYSIPPWRLSRIYGLSGLFLAMLYAFAWMMEFELWLCIWFYYGLFLALRWCWRHNPIGQTVDTASARRGRQQRPAYDPHAAPQQYYDLRDLDQR